MLLPLELPQPQYVLLPRQLSQRLLEFLLARYTLNMQVLLVPPRQFTAPVTLAHLQLLLLPQVLELSILFILL